MRAGPILAQTGSALGLLLAVVLFNFILLHAAPGDVAEAIAGATGGATKESLDEIRHIYGLDQSLPRQFLIYVGNLLHGDLGTSAYFNAPVAGLILERLFPTILLVGAALTAAVWRRSVRREFSVSSFRSFRCWVIRRRCSGPASFLFLSLHRGSLCFRHKV
jgi:ABC-type microcin C transport system permease subunit YejB